MKLFCGVVNTLSRFLYWISCSAIVAIVFLTVVDVIMPCRCDTAFLRALGSLGPLAARRGMRGHRMLTRQPTLPQQPKKSQAKQNG